MKIWWEFRCDRNHLWAVQLEGFAEPSITETTCPVDGSQAVTANGQKPVDRVTVTIAPAARVTDTVTNAIGHDADYFLEISSADESDRRRSAKTFGWDDVVKKAGLFQRISWKDALVRWNRTGLGRG